MKHTEITEGMLDNYAHSPDPCVRAIVDALQAERAKPKDDVWKDAPEWATHTRRVWFKPMETEVYSEIITRTLPKTRAREIAEEFGGTAPEIDKVERLILKREAELKDAGR